MSPDNNTKIKKLLIPHHTFIQYALFWSANIKI